MNETTNVSGISETSNMSSSSDSSTAQVPAALVEQLRRWPYYGEVLDFICTFVERTKEPWAREAVEELRSQYGSPTVSEHYAYLEAAGEAFARLAHPTPSEKVGSFPAEANEVDRLRQNLRAVAALEYVESAALVRLRGAVEAAPHEPYCLSWPDSPDLTHECTCWKTRAL